MYEELQHIISASRRIVFFGGAGVSTESGIPDFRSVGGSPAGIGLYNQKYDYPPETILSATFFHRCTEEFYRFYRDKMLTWTPSPTPPIFSSPNWSAQAASPPSSPRTSMACIRRPAAGMCWSCTAPSTATDA